MFSFMLVSAVSFSIYMRASRAPSSYVRRNTSARQLIKAALARAVDEIDTAIGNDPFPGVGHNHFHGARYASSGEDKGKMFNSVTRHDGRNDDWHGRVFTPLDEIPTRETVSTLSLEALGYLPPSLINEVRYWSRHTRTARWHSFNYGLGRYAFTAVNVSDFFDLRALSGRDESGNRHHYLNRSSAPHGRISPTYLFRGDEKADMHKGRSDSSKFLKMLAEDTPEISLYDVPLVSLMDYNLAYYLKDRSLALEPPFLGSTGGFMVGSGSKMSEAEARRQMFIAGGWNGSSNVTYDVYEKAGIINLEQQEFQPFYKCAGFPDNTSLKMITSGLPDNPFLNHFSLEEMPAVTMAMLCDYLDYDNVPLSLCIPTTEAVPMLCGVQLRNPPPIKMESNMAESSTVDNSDPQNPKTMITRTYTINVTIPSFDVMLTSVFPFKNPVMPNGGFDADVVARVFFTDTSGSAWSSGGLRCGGTGPAISSWVNWPQAGWSSDLSSTPPKVSYQQVSVDAKSVNANGVSGSASEASTIQGNIRFPMTGWQPINFSADFVYEGSVSPANLKSSTCNSDISLYDSSWNTVSLFSLLDASIRAGGTTPYFQPSIAVWARIKSGNDTVDMVPADPDCDQLNGTTPDKIYADRAFPGYASSRPMLRFFPTLDNGNAIQTSLNDFPATPGTPISRTTSWTESTPSYIANDPRINWAPEMWYLKDGNPDTDWLTDVHSFQAAQKWRDLDIFMGSSDQGYLQSMYELMMIPQVQRFAAVGNAIGGVFEGATYNGAVRGNIDAVAFNEVMWRTYRGNAFYREPTDRSVPNTATSSDPRNWGSIDDIKFIEASNGLRVNPYTDITNLMIGAFANMPRNWWAAGTNWNNSTWNTEKKYMSPDSADFKDADDYLYSWSKKWDSVYDTAAFWMEQFRGLEGSVSDLYKADGWKDVFDDTQNVFDWSGEHPDRGVDLMSADFKSEISSSVDRKFLYGYLKGCFANNSQLFLVFVRAESVAGGGGAGSGGKAVALVWRDPHAPTGHQGMGDDNARHYLKISNATDPLESWRLNPRKPEHPPHRTIVLFYHQLD